jgi:hypothetical protein
VFAPPKEFMNRNAVNITVGGGMMGNPNYYTDGSAGGGLDFRVADPRGTGGALEGSPRGPQQQNPYDSLKKLFGGNLQRRFGGFEPSRSFWSHRSTNWANARFSNKLSVRGS